jgi:hypothetical protein
VRDGQRAEEAEHARAAPDLGGAGGTALDMGGQACGIGGHEVVEEEEIDELARLCAVQRATVVRVRHITYMT